AAVDGFSARAEPSGILALSALGRQHDALVRYRAFRSLLDEELGLEPTPETRAVEGLILRQEDVLPHLPRRLDRGGERATELSSRLPGRTAELPPPPPPLH